MIAHEETGKRMKWIRLLLSLAFFVPACAMLGRLSTLDSAASPWWGMTAGGVVGAFFGPVFGGARGDVVGIVYPPTDHDAENSTCDSWR